MSDADRLATLRRKIDQLRELDAQHKVFGADRHQYDRRPVLEEWEVAAFESKHAIVLPAEYRLFLTQIANGGAGPYYGLYSLDKSVMEQPQPVAADWLARPFPFDQRATREFIDYYQACLDEGEDEIDYPAAPASLAGALYLAEYGCGWFYLLVVSGEQAGTVWFYGDNLYPIFDEGRQWSFFDWYEDWLDRSLAQFDPAPPKKELGDQNRILNYDGWQLEKIPAEVFANRGLKKLVFSRNKLSQLPAELWQLTELRTLDLSMTAIVDIPDDIAALQKLKKLRLNYNNHLTLPEALGRLEALEELSLYYSYKMTQLPAVVGRLKSLKKLNVCYSAALTALPDSLGDLANLEYLAVNDTKLAALPASIGRLQNLKYLYLGHTALERLPASLAELQNLEILDLSAAGLDIAAACAFIKDLPRLRSLTLLNQLELPAQVAELKNVRCLALKQNYVLWRQGHKQFPVPANVGLFPNLEELDLMSNNQAAALPETIGNLKKLKRLNLLSTAIRDFPASLRFTALEEVKGLLSKDPKAADGILPSAKQKLSEWFPQARLDIW